MRLTPSSRQSLSNDNFPTAQLFILAICRVAEPIALTSIFPYSWLMVKGFKIGSPNDASFYAGILISAFALAESMTGMWWGGLSDRIGRKPVLILGCLGTVLSLLVVGFSKSFAMALTGRVLGGLLNGNVGVIQTMVGELVQKPEHEPKAYSVMPFVWSIGTIIGPAVGGTFAMPVKSFPGVFAEDGFFGAFPWLLPNLICAFLMCFSILASCLWLKETHPDFRKDTDRFVHHENIEQVPVIAAAGITSDPAVDLRQDSYGTFNEVDIDKDELWEIAADGSALPPSTPNRNAATEWFTWKLAMLLVALGLYSYHAMCYDHLLPIFLQDDRADGHSVRAAENFFHIAGGVGLTTKTVGLIMSVNGIIALFIQAVIFPVLVARLGVWRVFALVTIFHPMAYFVVPYITLLPENLLFPGIYACLTLRNLFTILQYPVTLILLKQASPSPSVLGRINGLAASVGAASRTIAPPFAGYLYGVGLDIGFTGLAWWGAGIAAFFGTVQLYFIPHDKGDQPSVRSAAPFFATGMVTDEGTASVVKITVIEDETTHRTQV